MTTPSSWATQQLAEFLAVLTGAPDERAAVADAMERLAESFEADAGAFVEGGRVVASLGWASGAAPEADLIRQASTPGDGGVEVTGVGHCETVVIPVDRDQETTLILARATYGFSAEEVGLLRGMARVLALGLRLVGTLESERRQAEENGELVATLRERQALLERLSRIQRKISSRDPLGEVLNAITAGAAELLGDEVVALRLIDERDPAVMVGVSSVGIETGLDESARRLPITTGVGGHAIATGELFVVDDYRAWSGAIGAFANEGICAAMGAPVHGGGSAIGSLVVASTRPGRTYSEAEREILVAFAEHASLALNDARTVQAMNAALTTATHQAMHDDLTGLPNRACFYDRTAQALRVATREHTATAVLLFDLDRFKEINDTLGHKYGDRVLCAIGPRIREGLRASDTLARLGGDEFCVLLAGVAGLGGALDVAERIIGLLEAPFDIDGMTLAVDASCGIAIAPKDGDTVDMLLQRADVAMYVAKDSDANVVVYDDDLNVNTRGRLALLGELRAAIAQNQLVLHYQPKSDLASGNVEGVEALVRWEHPTHGLIPPNLFIPLAEHTGLIKPLTTWVLNTALAQLRCWQDQADPLVASGLTMAVNLSTRSLLDDAFPAEVVAALQEWGISPRRLVLEITESAIIADPVRAYRLLSELSACGVKLSIDDFGTGYSSLAYLKNLPVDELKIDKSFVLNMQHDANDAIIVRSVIDLGHNLGLRIVAEGIEKKETWDQLAGLGCDAAQGFFVARPMPAEEFEAWVRAPAAYSGVST